MVFRTKRQAEERIKEWSTWAASAVVGLGVAMCMTIVFLPSGTRLILAGTGIGVAGWVIGSIAPRFLTYNTVVCPRCRTSHEVFPRTIAFECEGCGKRLYGKGFWMAGGKGTLKGKRRKLLFRTGAWPRKAGLGRWVENNRVNRDRPSGNL